MRLNLLLLVDVHFTSSDLRCPHSSTFLFSYIPFTNLSLAYNDNSRSSVTPSSPQISRESAHHLQTPQRLARLLLSFLPIDLTSHLLSLSPVTVPPSHTPQSPNTISLPTCYFQPIHFHPQRSAAPASAQRLELASKRQIFNTARFVERGQVGGRS